MTLERIPEIVDGLPNISGWEDEVRALTRSKEPVFLPRIAVDLERVQAAFAIGLHMHQPLILDGDDLTTARMIGNLQYMMENQQIHGNHDALFAQCYWRTADFVRELVDLGRRPRVMLDYSGCLLFGLRQMGRGDILDNLRTVVDDERYWPYVEWLGTTWGHAVVPSTPIPDIELGSLGVEARVGDLCIAGGSLGASPSLVEEPPLPLHRPLIAVTLAVGAFAVHIEERFHPAYQARELGPGVRLDPRGVGVLPALLVRQPSADEPVERHARRHRGDQLAHAPGQRVGEQEIRVPARGLHRDHFGEIDAKLLGDRGVQLQLLEYARLKLVEHPPSSSVGSPQHTGREASREHVEKEGVLRDEPDVPLLRERAVAQPAHEGMRQALERDPLSAVPEVLGQPRHRYAFRRGGTASVLPLPFALRLSQCKPPHPLLAVVAP